MKDRRVVHRLVAVTVGAAVVVGGAIAVGGSGRDREEVVVAAATAEGGDSIKVIAPPSVDSSPGAVEAARARGLVLAGARDDGTPWGYIDMEALNESGRRRSADPTLITELQLHDADGSSIGVVVSGFNRPISTESWADPELRRAITGEAEAGVIAERDRREADEQVQK